MALDTAKLEQLILYVCASCEPHELGKTKLHKALWYADLNSYRELGEPITGETYKKDKFGPVAVHLDGSVRRLQDSSAVRVDRDTTTGGLKWEFEALVEADTSWMTDEQRRIVDQAVRFVVRENTASSISRRSHDRIWEVASLGEELPLYTAFASELGEVTQDDVEWAKSVVAED